MTGQDATLEYIDFLRQRGSISHIVKSGEGTSLSTLALTQRCLASGITFPVPLPDGSVGVSVPGDIPPALAALDVVIEAVPKATDPEEPDAPAVETLQVQSMSGEQEEELEAQDASPASPATEEGENSHFDGEVATFEQDVAFDGPDHQAGMSDGITPLPEASIDPARAGDEAVDIEHGDGQSDGADQDTSEVNPEQTEVLPADPDSPPEWVQTQLDMASEIAVRLDALAAEQTALAQRIDGFAGHLEEVATRPVPRPDATEFNLGMARMTAAFANGVRRLEAALEAIEAWPRGSDAGDALATGLAAISEAILAQKAAPVVAGVASEPELAVMASMQETISHQLAKLIEAHQVAQPPAMEEFLLDLRHATAELLAEQARLAKVG